MDNIIKKFYSTGKDRPPQYSQFGAFSSSMIANKNPISSLSIKTINDIKPAYNPINPKTQPLNYRPYVRKKPREMTQEEFLRQKNLTFNSASNMLYTNLRYNPLGEIGLMKENLSLMNKKNATKIQMIEEKMKNLELKNQRLEVINDFFFDMFENNLVKDEIQRKRELKAREEENKILNEDSSEYSNTNNNFYRKKRKKFKKSRSDVNLNIYQRYKRKDFDPIDFQQKTAMNARSVLENIKRNLGTLIVEDELKKNEQFQTLNEGINDLKADLNSKLDKIQKNQNQQMQKIYFCLLNSGDKKIENAAFRLFNEYSENNNDLIRNLQYNQSSRKPNLRNSFRKQTKISSSSIKNNDE